MDEKRVFLLLFVLVFTLFVSGFVSSVCWDGTAENACSTTKPLRCVGGDLIDDCATCGCDGSKYCQSQRFCTKNPSTINAYAGNIYYVLLDNCLNPSLWYLRTLGCDNVSSPNYMSYAGGTSRDWTFFTNHADFILNGDYASTKGSVDPTLKFGEYFVLHYNLYGKEMDTPNQFAYVKNWALARGYNFDDFLFHYRSDSDQTRPFAGCANQGCSATAHTRFIPGWDSANDIDSDGINDYLYYGFNKTIWTNTAPLIVNIPAGATVPSGRIYIRATNNLSEVTSQYTISVVGVQITIQPRNAGVVTVYVPYIGEKQTGAPNPNAHAEFKNQSTLTAKHYWNSAINLDPTIGFDVEYPTGVTMVWNLKDARLRLALADWAYAYLYNESIKGRNHDLFFVDDSNNRLIDSVCGNCVSQGLINEQYNFKIDPPNNLSNTYEYKQDLNATFLEIKRRLNNTKFENVEIYPNTAGTYNQPEGLVTGVNYWPIELFNSSQGFWREWSHKMGNTEGEFNTWKNHLAVSEAADKWQFLHFTGLGFIDMASGGVPQNLTGIQREQMYSLATYYQFKYPKLSFFYGYKSWSGWWFNAIEKDIGVSVGPSYSWKNFIDTTFTDDPDPTGGFPEYNNHTIYRRNYTKGIVFSWFKITDGRNLHYFNLSKTFTLDPADLNQGYCVLNVDGTLGQCNPTEITMLYVSGVILIKGDINDPIPPSPISNLGATSSTENSATLQWTATGDDGSTGTASSYDLRYSTSAITSVNFASATQASGEPVPQASGTLQSMTVSGLNPNTLYYFAIKAADDAGNYSSISNIVSYSTLASVPCGDFNGDLKVNVIDLALTVFWQGKNNAQGDWTNYDHIDINSDGKIDMADVTLIRGQLGKVC